MRIFLTGGNGMVGRALQRRLAGVHDVIAPRRAELDVRDERAVREWLRRARPDCVIHAAAPFQPSLELPRELPEIVE